MSQLMQTNCRAPVCNNPALCAAGPGRAASVSSSIYGRSPDEGDL